MRHRSARLKLSALAFAACVGAGAAPGSASGADGAVSAAAPAVPGGAHVSAGGAVSAPGDPVVERVTCKTVCPGSRRARRKGRRGKRRAVKARPGSVVKLKGEFLDYVDYVVFRGATGPIRAPLTYRDSIRVRAMVPDGAISSRPYVIDSRGVRSNRSRRKLVIRPPRVAGAGVFPILGPHSYGGAGSRFGAGRSGHSHQGQDVMASCGTPLVSVMDGTVDYAGYQGAAGNYIVIDNNGSSTDFVYMHLAYPALVRKINAPVAAGQQIGAVGATGNAQGCHLHFEYWQGDWYGGGSPIDPLPYLRAWDATG
ncbi:MAG: M23 family metallopeptidase [Solirubrobacterales bacterium]